MILPICYYGDAVLRKHCEEVKEMTDELRELIQNMYDTIEDSKAPGVGLAAPQVGRALRLFVTKLPVLNQEGQWIDGEHEVWINPKLSAPSEIQEEEMEGCLSLPGLMVPVSRPDAITIEALDIEMKPVKRVLQGYLARVIMHENDHLNGVLTVDRTNKRYLKQPGVKKALKSLKNKSKN